MPIPKFTELMNPVISTLRDLGGSARPAEVYPYIARNLRLSEEDLNQQKPKGGSLFENRVAWARFFLAKTGYIDSSRRGVWALTEKGRKIQILSNEQIQEIVRETQYISNTDTILNKVDKNKPNYSTDTDTEQELETLTNNSNYAEDLIFVLQSLPPSGFERLCQRLLRESGFQQVTVTGRSGDGGIDGIGVLQVNPFVTFKVIFQSKRYLGSVTSSQVRDFRGAMMGRADKGLIITTGTFTADAKSEAVRDGVPPIELIDSNNLIALFEQLELGLKPRITYDIDQEFFYEFFEDT